MYAALAISNKQERGAAMNAVEVKVTQRFVNEEAEADQEEKDCTTTGAGAGGGTYSNQVLYRYCCSCYRFISKYS